MHKVLTRSQFEGHSLMDVSKSYLDEKGYKLLNANYRTRIGYIDIIAEKRQCANLFGYPIPGRK